MPKTYPTETAALSSYAPGASSPTPQSPPPPRRHSEAGTGVAMETDKQTKKGRSRCETPNFLGTMVNFNPKLTSNAAMPGLALGSFCMLR